MAAERVVHQTGQADADVANQVEYLLHHAGPATALRFIDNAERAFEQLRAMPGLGALVGLDELPYEDVRRWHVDGFDRVLVLYRVVADGVEVIRVLHTSRDIAALLRETPD